MSKSLLMVLVLVVAMLVVAVVPAVSAVTQIVEIEPEADSVTKEAYKNKNYGDETWLWVDDGSKDHWTWLKFNLAPIDPDAIITYANLRLYSYKIPSSGLKTTGAFHSTDDLWTEMGITWYNQPTASSTPTAVIDPVLGWNHWDVISDVQSDVVAGDRKSTWCLKYHNHDSDKNLKFRSKEYGHSRPYIRVHYVIGNIESSDAGGSKKDVFSQADDVYCLGTAKPNTYVDIYVVHNRDWALGDPLTDVSGGVETVLAGGDGSIPITKIWDAPLNSGSYDIVVDIDRDGILDAGEPIDGRTNTGFKVTFACTCGDVCVNTLGWWRDGGDFNASVTPIQAAVGNAAEGETVCVKDGTYNENVDVNKQRLTITSENGSASTTVQAADPNDCVFEITADWVNITGFTVKDAAGNGAAGIYLSDADNCRVRENTVTDNYDGIRVNKSSQNLVADNTVHHNTRFGVLAQNEANYNRVENNTVHDQTSSWNGIGIGLFDNSDHNRVFNNTVHDNAIDNIELWLNSCYNTVEQNRCYNAEYGILLANKTDHNRIINNELYGNDYGIGAGVLNDSWGLNPPTNISVRGNWIHENTKDGILLDRTDNNSLYENNCSANGWRGMYLNSSANSRVTNNTANSNSHGVYLNNADNNNITCNWVAFNAKIGFYLADTSTGNNISCNNILVNGKLNGELNGGGWEWNFYNAQTNDVAAENNWWGTDNETLIAASIKEYSGAVNFKPFEPGPVSCAPIPEAVTVVLFSVGLVVLVGYVRIKRKD